MSEEATTASTSTGVGFQPTAWTVILDNGNREALEQLCKTYWPPIYSFLRRSGHPPENAKDLTQGFFVHLLAKERLKKVHPAKGKFRSFLLACLNNYVRNEWDKERSQKRGGGVEVVSIDVSETEQRYGVSPVDTQDPAKMFEQRWARALLTQVLEQLKQNLLCGFALMPPPASKAVLKPPQSKRCRAGLASSNLAKCLDCGAFTAAFPQHQRRDMFVDHPPKTSASSVRIGIFPNVAPLELGEMVSSRSTKILHRRCWW